MKYFSENTLLAMGSYMKSNTQKQQKYAIIFIKLKPIFSKVFK